MNIENHIHNAKNCLDQARDKITAGEYHSAIHSLASAYSDVRALLEQVYKLDHESIQAFGPAGKDLT